VKPHASSEIVTFSHFSEMFTVEHPADWKAHEVGARTNIGADDVRVTVCAPACVFANLRVTKRFG
jgi:hypothetical protein